jgi:hypothetical protein
MTDHYKSAQKSINDANDRMESVRGEVHGVDLMPTLLSALIDAVSAVAHAQLATIDATKLAATDEHWTSDITAAPRPATELRWHPGDDEPAKHVVSLEYHSYSPERPTSTIREFLHQQSGGGWLWSTSRDRLRSVSDLGRPWKRVTTNLDGYFTEVKR